MPQTALDRAIALWGGARIAIAASRRTRTAVATARRRSPARRVLRLASGANDRASGRTSGRDRRETWVRRCPRCQGDVIEPVGRATSEDGLVKIDLWCDACNYPFTFLRKPRN